MITRDAFSSRRFILLMSFVQLFVETIEPSSYRDGAASSVVESYYQELQAILFPKTKFIVCHCQYAVVACGCPSGMVVTGAALDCDGA